MPAIIGVLGAIGFSIFWFFRRRSRLDRSPVERQARSGDDR